jgi:hypothetical protein
MEDYQHQALHRNLVQIHLPLPEPYKPKGWRGAARRLAEAIMLYEVSVEKLYYWHGGKTAIARDDYRVNSVVSILFAIEVVRIVWWVVA